VVTCDPGGLYDFDVAGVTAFVLAGGKSSRMGCDKARLSLRGQTLLERAQASARRVAEEVRIVGPAKKYGTLAIEDVYAEQGPLGGIHAALASSTTELNLILSVDTPFITPEFLKFLVAEAEAGATTVTVPFVGGKFQPLCAVYRQEFVPLAESALRAGRNKIDPLFCHTTVRRIDEAELVRLAFDPRMFDNLNTPGDFARARNRR
jgi:molybdopterin-guanine dinucleotide biosynthesis protein A